MRDYHLGEMGRRGRQAGTTHSRVARRETAWPSRPASGWPNATSPRRASCRPPGNSAGFRMTRRTTRLLLRRCSAPATPSRISGAGRSWIPPTGRARWPPIRSCSIGTPTAPQPPAAKQRIADLEESFATKEYKSAMFYLRLKAYDSAVLYLRDLVATYPRTSVAPEALIKLVEVYNKLGLRRGCGGDLRLSPSLPSRRAPRPMRCVRRRNDRPVRRLLRSHSSRPPASWPRRCSRRSISKSCASFPPSNSPSSWGVTRLRPS